ncbi:MAG: ATP-binding cassette domain-containing protein, partial [Bacteroidales bacterium]|nr:ATP-binding cassette domain-containing protein [Bacteroidales bacterium]
MLHLEIDNVSKEFAAHKALNSVSFSVETGKIFGLLGPNGAGKTTLIRIINQILAPDQGTVLIKGQALQEKHIYTIGYLPEERGLYKKMKVGEHAIYLAQLKGLKKAEAQKRLDYWFEKFEIKPWWNKKVEELSKGMQQKVQFIATILHQPELLIFDEPFSGFDPVNTNLIKNEILNLRNNGATIIFSTHNMSSVEELCDEIALINKSNLILSGKVQDIRKTYGANKYEIKYSGYYDHLITTLTSNFKILNQSKNGNETTLNLELVANISTNDLIQQLMKSGNIISFKKY